MRLLPLSAALLLLSAPGFCAEEAALNASAGSELNNRAVTAAQAGDFEQAAQLLRQACRLSPDDLQIRRNRAAILADWAQRLLEQEGRPDRAKEALRESLEADPGYGKSLFLLGDLEYNSGGELAAALELWKKAFEKSEAAADRSALQQRIGQAERDLRIERGFSAVNTKHFSIRFEEQAQEKTARSLADLLEKHHRRFSGVLGAGPSPLTVILYSEKDFRRIAGKDWALGLYDGRIRLRSQDAEAGRAEPLLAHELAHAFLARQYGPLVPVWLHEGFAQAMEPERQAAPGELELERQIASRAAWVPLRWLDRRFQQPSGLEDLHKAYLQARFTVRRLLQKEGEQKFRNFLRLISAGTPLDKAYNQSFSPSTWGRIDQGNFD